jgi:uncharacterized protein
MYDLGRGVPRDETEAVAWLRKAAAQGNTDAKALLAILYVKNRARTRAEEIIVESLVNGGNAP